MSKLRIKRRRFQFSLRTIFIVMTLLALWLGYVTHRARQQRQAVELIEKLGGGVFYDYPDRGDGEAPGPPWLRRLIGDEYFVSVIAVSLYGTQITDAGVEHLKDLTNLQHLGLESTDITDAALVHLRGMTSLEGLGLSWTRVTDGGLEHLRGLTNLRALILYDTRISDGGLEHLKALTNLRELNLYETQVTDAGVSELQKALPNCLIHHVPTRDANGRHSSSLGKGL